MRRSGVYAALVVLAALFAAPARATVLEAATVDVVVAQDGSLLVSEKIAMGDVFHGAYRDIPLRSNYSIDRIAVSEQGRRYAVGGSTELGSIGSPDTYATTRIGSSERIVWHFDNPSGGVRTFTVSYRLRGLTVAYDDVADVYLQVWGKNWKVSLPSLAATMRLPSKKMSPSYRVWGMPVYVHGTVTRTPGEALLRASSVPPGQYVELRVVFPRSFLTSTAGAQVRSGAGLEKIVAQQEASYAAYDRDRRRIHDALVHWKRTLAILFGSALLPALLITALVYGFFGRDRSKGYDRSYEQEPPSDLSPALASPLLRQRSNAGANEFTATLFDLVRRGHYKAAHVTTEQSTWAGLHKTEVADLELSKGKAIADLTPWEQAVVRGHRRRARGERKRASVSLSHGDRRQAHDKRDPIPALREGGIRRDREAELVRQPRPRGARRLLYRLFRHRRLALFLRSADVESARTAVQERVGDRLRRLRGLRRAHPRDRAGEGLTLALA